MKPENVHYWICPDISTYWKLTKLPNQDEYILQALEGNLQHLFSAEEAYALRYFNGRLTVEQVQKLCQRKQGDTISSNFVVKLLQKLITLEVLALVDAEPKSATTSIPQLKACVQWTSHPDGYWILSNPEDVTYLQMDERSKAVIDELGQLPLEGIAQKHNVSLTDVRSLLQHLAANAMLEGTTLPTPPKNKFSPSQLLSFKISLFNPDTWLTNYIDNLRWIWTQPFAITLCFFLAFSSIIGLSQRADIVVKGQQLFTAYGSSLIIPFCLLAMLVVTLHELGHAFTLKHYGGIVPEVGLLFMLLIPAAYTNTTDSYRLVKGRQRVLVIAAGVIFQLIIAACALWLWNISVSGSWLATTSYLLMVAALFTVAVNLNPLAKFDGYYLAVALTGINNLRTRCFGLYANLLRRQPIQESSRDALILAAYAPLSFVYLLTVFGFIFYRVTDWSLTNIPTLAFTLLTLWAIYFYFPTNSNSKQS